MGHAIGNWRGNWDGTFHHFLGRFLCGFGCIPPNWQILVPWLWLHTTLLPLTLLHKERLHTGLTDSKKYILDKNTIRDWKSIYSSENFSLFSWQILVSWFWLHTTPLPLALPHKERLYTGLIDSKKYISDKNTIRDWKSIYIFF